MTIKSGEVTQYDSPDTVMEALDKRLKVAIHLQDYLLNASYEMLEEAIHLSQEFAIKELELLEEIKELYMQFTNIMGRSGTNMI